MSDRLTKRTNDGTAIFSDDELSKGIDIAGAVGRHWEKILNKLAHIEELAEQKRLIILPCAVGDTVYVLCECNLIEEQLDGTYYDCDGSPGTATGYYCPYEKNCPHDTDDCESVKDITAVFEDIVDSYLIADDEISLLMVDTPNVNIRAIGKTVFLDRESAEQALQAVQDGS